MEISVSFTEKAEMMEAGYQCDESELGKVYYQTEGVEIQDKILVKYVQYPWMECFEVEGIEILGKNEFSFDFPDDILKIEGND